MMDLVTADRIGNRFLHLLEPLCEEIVIAGSVRRGKPDNIKDVEIVARPQQRPIQDLYGRSLPIKENLLEPHIQNLIASGMVSLREMPDGMKRNGEKYKALTFEDVAIDLFIVIPPAQWGVILMIRTGPADFTKKMVTSRRHGGFLPSHLKVREGAVWLESEILPMPYEEDYFATCGIDWLRPEVRK